MDPTSATLEERIRSVREERDRLIKERELEILEDEITTLRQLRNTSVL
jgi:hypothetical protein